jgi:hypothetical protein
MTYRDHSIIANPQLFLQHLIKKLTLPVPLLSSYGSWIYKYPYNHCLSPLFWDYNYKKYLIKVRKIYHIHLHKQYRIKYSPVWKKYIITVNIYHILKKILSHQKYYTTDTNNKYKSLDLYNVHKESFDGTVQTVLIVWMRNPDTCMYHGHMTLFNINKKFFS